MVTIDNNIGTNFKCTLYREDEKVGEITSALSFFDVLCQIKAQHLDGYSIRVMHEEEDGTHRIDIFKIDRDGRMSPSAKKNIVLWNTILERQFLFLYGMSESVVYSKNNSV